jgi:hypothetical protein
MSVRTTIDLPEELYEALRQCAASEHSSIRSLVVAAIEARFKNDRRTIPVLKPPVPGRGKPGPLRPGRENPYDILFA